MASGAASDPFVAVAWGVGLVAMVLTVGLALQILAMRRRMARRERRRDRVLGTWRPLMFEYVIGGTPALPALAREDEESFLLLWNQIQDGVRGEPRAGLNQLAEAVGAHAMACRPLARGDALGRLLALRTLGYLGRDGDYAQVARHLDDPRPYLCLAAARALVHVAPDRAPDDVLPRLASRTDWPVPQFATVLGEAGAARVSARLRDLVPRLTREGLARLLPLLAIVDDATSDAILGDLLASAEDPEIVAAGLKRVRTPALLGHVRRACRHEAWTVRTQAAAALGRASAGDGADRDLLIALLRDPQWWVRYRAAQGLASGRFGSAAELAELVAGTGDRFAHDMFAHALAEDRE